MNSNMQAVLIFPMSPTFRFSYSPPELDEFAEISGEFAEDSRKKLKMDLEVNLKMEDENLRNEAVVEEKQVVHRDKEDGTVEKEEEEEEFSFACMNPDAMLVWAEDVFDNGYIRPMFPTFNPNLLFANGYGGGVHDWSSPLRPPLKKVFIQRPGISSSSSSSASDSNELDGAPEGPFCEWSGKAVVEEASPERCKKSNSTGFSKLWRLRDMFRRSNSNGKYAFVFLKPSSTSNYGTETEKVVVKSEKTSSGEGKNVGVGKVKAPKGAKRRAASSAQESNKRRSCLPYKVGFFTNVNGMSRNVHPF